MEEVVKKKKWNVPGEKTRTKKQKSRLDSDKRK